MSAERFPIEEGHVLLFARAIGDPNPAFRRGDGGGSETVDILAPPTFVQASAQFDPDYPLRPHDGRPWFGSGANPTGTPPATETGASTEGRGGGGGAARGSGLHAEQRYEYHRALRVGDVLSARTLPGKTWQKEGRRGGALVFSEMVTEYRDEAGELVVTATSVGVRTEKVPEQTGAS
ncbi:MAG: MaoC family dehydratase N-terminal domain-containing protein [Acidimicrobiales bacterium]